MILKQLFVPYFLILILRSICEGSRSSLVKAQLVSWPACFALLWLALLGCLRDCFALLSFACLVCLVYFASSAWHGLVCLACLPTCLAWLRATFCALIPPHLHPTMNSAGLACSTWLGSLACSRISANFKKILPQTALLVWFFEVDHDFLEAVLPSVILKFVRQLPNFTKL